MKRLLNLGILFILMWGAIAVISYFMAQNNVMLHKIMISSAWIFIIIWAILAIWFKKSAKSE